MAAARWNPNLYQTSHSFVWEFGRELVGLLKDGQWFVDYRRLRVMAVK